MIAGESERQKRCIYETIPRDPDGAIQPDAAYYHFDATSPAGIYPSEIMDAFVADLEAEFGEVTEADLERFCDALAARYDELEALGLEPDDGAESADEQLYRMRILQKRWENKYDDIFVLPPQSPRRDRKSWQRVLFRTNGAKGYRIGRGIGWRVWAITKPYQGPHRIIHMPSGFGFGKFADQEEAQRHCEAIDGLADWRSSDPERLVDALESAAASASRRLKELKGE